MMMTNSRTHATASRGDQARHQDLQTMLLERERELQNVMLRRVRDEATHRPQGGLDDTEHAEADIQEHIEVALIQMKGETLLRVREALVRLDAGDYGYCADCEGEIAQKRLKALPFAVRCMACEEAYEKRTTMTQRAAGMAHSYQSFADQAGS